MMMKKEEAVEFASRWLPAWTGNKPEVLASYYSDDCLYLDAGIPNGASGKTELIAYFRKLLAQNPDWVWSQIEAIPMEGGFLNKWLAKIPVGEKTLECIGVCFLQFDEQGKIKRNEVYFDRTELVSEIYNLKKEQNCNKALNPGRYTSKSLWPKSHLTNFQKRGGFRSDLRKPLLTYRSFQQLEAICFKLVSIRLLRWTDLNLHETT